MVTSVPKDFFQPPLHAGNVGGGGVEVSAFNFQELNEIVRSAQKSNV